jgi:hypothetical protein
MERIATLTSFENSLTVTIMADTAENGSFLKFEIYANEQYKRSYLVTNERDEQTSFAVAFAFAEGYVDAHEAAYIAAEAAKRATEQDARRAQAQAQADAYLAKRPHATSTIVATGTRYFKFAVEDGKMVLRSEGTYLE